MPYVLGIDVGTCRTAAAVCRQSGSKWGDAETVQLGERTATAPTVVYFASDGTVVVGDAAQRHAGSDPANAVRDFARRVGDDVPLLVGREAISGEALTAVLVSWVVSEVSAAENGPPRHIVVTHPAGWGNHRRRLLHRALRQTNLNDVTLLPSPVAIGESQTPVHDVPAGEALAVYDLGASGLSTAVVRRSPIGTFELLKSTDSVEPNGGNSFDDVVFEHVRGSLGGLENDPNAWATLSRLRQECTAGKEFLSASTEVTIRDVRLSRAEFEDMIRSAVQAGVEELLRTIRAVPDLNTVVLTGGSARIPLVGELVKAEVRTRTVITPEPELACARGAAIAAKGLVPAPQAAPPPPVNNDEEPPQPPRPTIEVPPLELPKPRSVMRMLTGKPKVFGAAGALVLGAGVALTFYLSPGEQPKPAPNPGSTAVAPVNNAGSTTTLSTPRPLSTTTGATTVPPSSTTSSSKKSTTTSKTGGTGR